MCTTGHTSRQSEIDLKVLDNLENQSKLLSNNINAMLSHISESTHNVIKSLLLSNFIHIK